MDQNDIRLRQSVLNGSARAVTLSAASAAAATTPFVASWELVSDWQAP